MTLRALLNHKLADEYCKKILARIPQGYSIDRAIKEARITDLEGNFLAVAWAINLSRKVASLK